MFVKYSIDIPAKRARKSVLLGLLDNERMQGTRPTGDCRNSLIGILSPISAPRTPLATSGIKPCFAFEPTG